MPRQPAGRMLGHLQPAARRARGGHWSLGRSRGHLASPFVVCCGSADVTRGMGVLPPGWADQAEHKNLGGWATDTHRAKSTGGGLHTRILMHRQMWKCALRGVRRLPQEVLGTGEPGKGAPPSQGRPLVEGTCKSHPLRVWLAVPTTCKRSRSQPPERSLV
jgi:hypothetical protein